MILRSIYEKIEFENSKEIRPVHVSLIRHTRTTFRTTINYKNKWDIKIFAFYPLKLYRIHVGVIVRAVGANYTKTHAHLTNLGTRYSQKRSFLWKNFILHFRLSFARRITFNLVLHDFTNTPYVKVVSINNFRNTKFSKKFLGKYNHKTLKLKFLCYSVQYWL